MDHRDGGRWGRRGYVRSLPATDPPNEPALGARLRVFVDAVIPRTRGATLKTTTTTKIIQPGANELLRYTAADTCTNTRKSVAGKSSFQTV